jgi:hypothetical protein
VVSLRGCIHHCDKGDQRLDPVVVAAGGRSPATQYGGVSALTGTRSWVAVESVLGKTLGCLVVDGHPDKSDGDLVRVTEMEPCGDSSTKAVVPTGRVKVESP